MTRKLTHKEAVRLGTKGGKSGTGKAKARDPEKMRQAALKRWRYVVPIFTTEKDGLVVRIKTKMLFAGTVAGIKKRIKKHKS